MKGKKPAWGVLVACGLLFVLGWGFYGPRSSPTPDSAAEARMGARFAPPPPLEVPHEHDEDAELGTRQASMELPVATDAPAKVPQLDIRVVDERGDPVEDASLFLRSADLWRAIGTSDASGALRRDLPCEPALRAATLVTDAAGFSIHEQPIDLTTGDEQIVVLEPSDWIVGRVVLPNGEPAGEGILVCARAFNQVAIHPFDLELRIRIPHHAGGDHRHRRILPDRAARFVPELPALRGRARLRPVRRGEPDLRHSR